MIEVLDKYVDLINEQDKFINDSISLFKDTFDINQIDICELGDQISKYEYVLAIALQLSDQILDSKLYKNAEYKQYRFLLKRILINKRIIKRLFNHDFYKYKSNYDAILAINNVMNVCK